MTSIKQKHSALVAYITLLLFASSIVKTQSKGSISGEVRDAVTKQPLPSANVLLIGTTVGASTDAKGYFVLRNLDPGSYQLRASMLGYETLVLTEIAVSSSRNKSVSFDLAPTAIELGAVSVTGDYFQKRTENAVSFKSLTPEEIRRSPGSAEDIFRVMQSLPGVATAGGKSAQLIVRGGSPDENLTLLDNVEVYNPIHFARTGESMGIISIINPALLKQVDFMTGGFPAKYGDKMSSVFEMSLQDGNKELNNSDLNANFGGFGAMVDGPAPGGGTMIFSARRGFFDLITSIMNRPAAPRYYDAVGKLTYDLDASNRLSFVGFYYLDQIERTGTTKSETVTPKYDYLTRDDYGSALGLNLRSLLTPQAFALTTLSLTSNGWSTLQGVETNRSLRGDDIRENEYAIKSEVNYQVGSSLEVKGGGAVKFIDSRHTAWASRDSTRTGQLIPATSVSYFPDVTSKLSVFLQSTWRPIPLLALSAGARYDYFGFTKESNLSPRLSMTYHLTDQTSISAAYGKFYQTPAAYQIALDPVNQLLKSSSAIHYVAGIEHRISDDTKATIEVYYKDLANLIVSNDTTNVLTNAGSGSAQGIEFSLQKKFNDGFVASASYTYSTSQRRDASFLPTYDFEYDRPHILNLIAGWQLSESWQIGAKFQYASGNPYTPIAGVEIKRSTYFVIDGEYNSARYPDYHKLDIRVDKKFNFGSWSITAYLDLWNIYNRQNVLSYSYKVDAAGIVTEQTRSDFGVLPIFGITAQF